MEEIYLCLDVGGTEIKAAPVDSHGTLLRPLRHFPAMAEEPADVLLENFANVIGEIDVGEEGSAGIHFAFPGPFDYSEGICLLHGLSKFDRLYGVNLRRELARRLNFPPERIRFSNDAGAFALGEMNFGAARGAERSMFVCVGTGCGSAFGIGGALAPAGTPGVPENGYIYGTPYLDGCIDDYISRRGLMELSLELLGEPLDGRELAGRAKEGDRGAGNCLMVFGERMREALTPLMRGFGPEVLCLGGQIMRSAELFIAPLRAACLELGVALSLTEDTSVRALQGLTLL